MRLLNTFSMAAALSAVLLHASSSLGATTPTAGAAPISPSGPISTTYVLHFAPEPRGDVAKHAQELLQSKFSTAFKQLAKADEKADGPTVFVETLNMKAEGFEPPSLRSLQYYGRGVSREQAEAMQKSTVAAALTFTYSAADAAKVVPEANAVMKELASRTAGLIWDVETRELYTPDALAARRLQPPDHGFLDVRAHITMHAYQATDYVRVITLGMRKFGLPDLVINEFAWSLNSQLGNTVNLFAQSLLEGARPGLGAYDFDVSRIRHAAVRAIYEDHLLDKAHPVARLTLAEAAADEGDPENRLIELRFDRYAGKTVHEKHQEFASTFFGSVDTVSYIKHNDAILAASERAKKRLPEIRKRFNAGLRPGERIMVKAPFERPDGGNEWMWVEVSSWKGDAIVGLLNNEPAEIPALHAGAEVKVSQGEVFDYLHYKADGTEEGNESGKEIAKAQDGR